MAHILTLVLCVAGFVAAGLVAKSAIDDAGLAARPGVERVASPGGDGVRGGFEPFVVAAR